MRSYKRFTLVLALASLVTATVLGCGQLPTAPQTVAPPNAAALSAHPAGLISTLGSVVDGVVGLIVQTLNLVGSLGGSLSNGCWRVTIPAGAVDGTATVSLGVKTLTSPGCYLQISPADKNHFAVPVTLTVDCRNIPTDRLSTYQILWLDPSTGNWVPVAGSKVDLTTKTVSAPLSHFSQYSVGAGGKAGW